MIHGKIHILRGLLETAVDCITKSLAYGPTHATGSDVGKP